MQKKHTTKMQTVIETAKHDGRDAAVRWWNRQSTDGRIRYMYDLNEHPERYGFTQKYSAPGHLYVNQWMRVYRSQWISAFEIHARQMFRDRYAAHVHHDDVIREHDLIQITDDDAWNLYNADPDHFQLFLECSLCGNVSAYGGYPAVPQTSTVMCLTCGYLQVGGKKYVPRSMMKTTPPT